MSLTSVSRRLRSLLIQAVVKTTLVVLSFLRTLIAYVWAAPLLLAIVMAVLNLGTDPLLDRHDFRTNPPLQTTSSLLVDPNTPIHFHLELKPPVPGQEGVPSRLYGYVPQTWPGEAPEPEERFDILISSFVFPDRRDLARQTVDYGVDHIAFFLDPNHPMRKPMWLLFSPEPFMAVSSHDMAVHRMAGFGYPTGRVLVAGKDFLLPLKVHRSIKWFPLEKQETQVSIGVVGHPASLPHTFPLNVMSDQPDWAAYYSVELHLQGPAGWKASFDSERLIQITDRWQNPYYITDEYVSVSLRRRADSILYILGPLISLIVFTGGIVIKQIRKSSVSNTQTGTALTVLLGVIGLRTTMVPREVLDSGVVTLYDVLTLVAISLVGGIFLMKGRRREDEPRGGGRRSRRRGRR